jgi:hypothetical protein
MGYTAAAWGHLITYSAMAIASYLVGQKFYPISYDLKKIGFYICLALLLFALSYFVIPFEAFGEYSFVAKIMINTFILLIYAAIIVKKEYKILKAVI